MSNKNLKDGYQPNILISNKSKQRNEGYQPQKTPIPPKPTKGSSAVPPNSSPNKR